MTPRDLAGSPFSDFLIPGLFLLVALGFGSALAAFLLWKRPGRISRLFALGLSASLIAWIAVQVAVVGYRGWLQPLYAALGVSLIALLTTSTD
jgi:pimeloyl-ACP methyl ester carboxylesterase